MRVNANITIDEAISSIISAISEADPALDKLYAALDSVYGAEEDKEYTLSGDFPGYCSDAQDTIRSLKDRFTDIHNEISAFQSADATRRSDVEG